MHLLIRLFAAIVLVFHLPAPCLSEVLRDSSGREISVERPFTRIISLYSAHTENLASLGAENELIGISSSDDYPPRVLGKPRFDYKEDPEKFIAARPDLVLARPMIERSYPQLLEKLRQAGIVVVSLQPNTVEEIVAYWRSLGVLTGRIKQAEEMVASFEGELEAIRKVVDTLPREKRLRVYFEAIHDKMKTFAAESIAAFVLEQAGGINVADDAGQVRETNIAYYGKERILAKAGEIDVFLAQRGRMNPVTVETILREPGFQALKAVREGSVFLVDERLVSRPTLRIIEGARLIGGILYPDLFPRQEPMEKSDGR